MCYFVPVIVLTSNDSYMYIYVGKDLIFTVVFQWYQSKIQFDFWPARKKKEY